MSNNPYLPSAASLEGAAAGHVGQDFRDLSGISRALSILLAAGAAAYVLYFTLLLTLQARLRAAAAARDYLPSPDTSADAPLGLLLLAQFLLLLVTAITFLRWIYLAHRNLPELGARYYGATPRWAVASFFVPPLLLWAPLQAMRDLAKVSRNPVRWDLEDTPLVVVAWWMLWLAQLVLIFGAGLHALPLRGVTLQVLRVVLWVLLYLAAYLVVRRIWRDQARQHAQLLPADGAD